MLTPNAHHSPARVNVVSRSGFRYTGRGGLRRRSRSAIWLDPGALCTAPRFSMMSAEKAMRPLRLVYLVTEDWYFVSHRLPMARAAKAAGYEVHVITRVDRCRTQIEAEGFVVHPTDLARGSLRPDRLFAAARAVRARYHAIGPDLVHHVAVQCVVIGLVAAIGLRLPTVNALTGLGSLFTKTGPLSMLAGLILPLLLRRRGAIALVQNGDDRALIKKLGVAEERITLIAGSGVDTDRLTPLPEPEGPVTFAYVGRMLEDKGVRTLIEAHRILQRAGDPPGLLLAGTSDPHNPTSVSEAELKAFSTEPGMTWLGHVADIRAVWARAHVAVLASRREGLPLSLLEAAACGRPMIATDVPGCREIALPDVNALLVPADDPAALAAAMRRAANDPELRRNLAAGSRPLVEARFSSRQIGQEIVALYARLLTAAGPGRPV
jgi:glycosyltransferase involved in cell wall biosynthesis